ncbi:MAG: nascent polypeptide-associated complex protein [Nitrososphaerota archaeon]|nr:nascent polypeptide-associated complex protein [Aigarchaeota archaeon]MDW8076575.1 nascent polypeptide-associated complex protein [Nitrososphaerota archaeon]
MRKLSSRELRRMQSKLLSSLGLDVTEQNVAKEVLIRLPDKEVVIKDPTVVVLQVGEEKVYQIIGGEVSEKKAAISEARVQTYEPSPEDITIVALQAGVSEEEAKRALIEVGGDLAKAILLLKSK